MTKFIRKCPSCTLDVEYKTKESLYMANYNDFICRRCHNNKKIKNKCENLLNESLESYYWLGFLMADGHFEPRSYNISISIHNKDKSHLIKLQNFLEVESIRDFTKQNQVNIAFGGKIVVSKILKKYAIKSNKTINPPNLHSIIGDNLKAFNIGFIDGDGCITYQTGRKDSRITIRVHANWLENLKYMFNRGKIGNDGYAKLCIGKYSEIIDYKNFIILNNLPHLNRKWDKVIIKNTT